MMPLESDECNSKMSPSFSFLKSAELESKALARIPRKGGMPRTGSYDNLTQGKRQRDLKLVGDEEGECLSLDTEPCDESKSIPGSQYVDYDDVEVRDALTFMLNTTPGGHNSGRSTILIAKNQAEKSEWKSFILNAVQQALENRRLSLQEPGFIARMQVKLQTAYASKPSEYFFGAIIMATYVSAMVQYELLPEPGSALDHTINQFEVFFTIIFAVELMINIAGNWWRPFASVLWNWMDAFVVIISVAGLIKEGLPAISVLRLFRVLKMIRLFRSLTQLRIMIDALYSAVLPVVNAFMLLLLVSTIYAIVGTDLFRDLAPEYFGRSPTCSSLRA
jgi:hypothetical protein